MQGEGWLAAVQGHGQQRACVFWDEVGGWEGVDDWTESPECSHWCSGCREGLRSRNLTGSWSALTGLAASHYRPQFPLLCSEGVGQARGSNLHARLWLVSVMGASPSLCFPRCAMPSVMLGSPSERGPAQWSVTDCPNWEVLTGSSRGLARSQGPPWGEGNGWRGTQVSGSPGTC